MNGIFIDLWFNKRNNGKLIVNYGSGEHFSNNSHKYHTAEEEAEAQV